MASQAAVAGRHRWRPSGASAAGFYNFICESPHNSKVRIGCSDVGGIWVTRDGGLNWQRGLDDGTGSQDFKICSVVWFPDVPGRVLAMSGSSGAGKSRVYESVNYGASFVTAGDNSGDQRFAFSGDNNENPNVGSGKGSNGPGTSNWAIGIPPADNGGTAGKGGNVHPRMTGNMAVMDTTHHLVYFSTFNGGIYRTSYTTGSAWGLGGMPDPVLVAPGHNKGVGFSTPSSVADFSDLYGTGITLDPADFTTVYMSTFGNGVWRLKNANTATAYTSGANPASPLYTPNWSPYFTATGAGWPSGTSPVAGTGPCRVHQLGWYSTGGVNVLILASNNDGVWGIKTASATPVMVNLTKPAGPDLPDQSTAAGQAHWQSLGLYHGTDGLQHIPVDASGNALLYAGCSSPPNLSPHAGLMMATFTPALVSAGGWSDPWNGNFSTIMAGSTKNWWIGNVGGFMPTGGNFVVAAIRVIGGGLSKEIHTSGRSGTWLTTDGYTTSHPAVNGIGSTFSKGGVTDGTAQGVELMFADYTAAASIDGGRTVITESANSLVGGSPYGYGADYDPVTGRMWMAAAGRDLTAGSSKQGGAIFSRARGYPPPTSGSGYNDEKLATAGTAPSSDEHDTFERTTANGWGTSTPSGDAWTVPSGAGAASTFSTMPGLVLGGHTVTGGSYAGFTPLGAPDGLALVNLANSTVHTINNAQTQNTSSGSLLIGFDTTAAAAGTNLFAGVRLLTQDQVGSADYTTFYEVRMVNTSGGLTQLQLRKSNSGVVDNTFFNGGVAKTITGWGAQPINTVWSLNWTLVTDGSGGVILSAWVVDNVGADSRNATGFSNTTVQVADGADSITTLGSITAFAGAVASPAMSVNAIFTRLTAIDSTTGTGGSVPFSAPLAIQVVPTPSGVSRVVVAVNQHGAYFKYANDDSFTQSAPTTVTDNDNACQGTQPSQKTMWMVSNDLTTNPVIYFMHPVAGVSRSTDYGSSTKRIWDSGTAGFPTFSTSFVGGMAIDPAHPDDLLVVTPANGLQIIHGARTGTGSIGVNGLLTGATISSVSGGPSLPGVMAWAPGIGLFLTNRQGSGSSTAQIWLCPSPSATTPIWNRIDDFFYQATIRDPFAVSLSKDSNILIVHTSENGVLLRSLT